MKCNVEWEVFQDESFYDMWAVRPVGDTDFNSPRLFHCLSKEHAEILKNTLDKCHCAVPKK